MKPVALVLLSTILSIGCHGDRNVKRRPWAGDGSKAGRQYTQESVSLNRPSPNVDITTYTLISDDLEGDRADAEAIMRLRGKSPQAVQTKDAALFEHILARGFIFRAADEFWNRDQYIRNRVEESETVGPAATRTSSCSFSAKWPCLLTATL